MTKLTNKYIEEKAIDIINQNITTQHISSRIEKGSTEESWDGHLLYYEDPTSKVDVMQIPVQVKGTTKTIDDNTFVVDISDLENYRPLGIVYFVVKIIFDGETPKDYKIYAKSMVGQEIEIILKSLKKGQKTKTISFNLISNVNDILDLCRAYKEKQIAVSLLNRFEIKKEKIVSKNVRLVGKDDKIYNFPEVGKQYFIVFEEGNIKKYEPDINITETRYKSKKGIYVGDIKYFDRFEIRKGVEYTKYIFDGVCIELNIKDRRTNVTIEKTNDNYKLLNNLKFLKNVIVNKCFYVDNKKIDLSITSYENDDLYNLDVVINQVELLIKFCESVGISQKIDYFNIPEVKILKINSILYDKEETAITSHFISTNEFSVAIIKLCKDNYNFIFNVFDEKSIGYYEFKIKEKYKFVSFAKLSIEEWSLINIFDLNEIYRIIDQCINFDDPIEEYVHKLITNLILAFDINSNEKLLDIASYLTKKLLSKKKGNALYHISDLEIKVRKKLAFDHFDRKLIDDLIALNIDVYKFIAHTLLSDKYNADKFISNIDESWLKHPIFNLYKNLK